MALTLLQQHDLSEIDTAAIQAVQKRTSAALRNYARYISNNGASTAPQRAWAAAVLAGGAMAEAVKAVAYMQGDPARDLGAQMDAMTDDDIKILAESAANAHLIQS